MAPTTDTTPAPETTTIDASPVTHAAEQYAIKAREAADAFLADPASSARLLLSIARTDGRAVARKALRASLLSDLRGAREAFGVKVRDPK